MAYFLIAILFLSQLALFLAIGSNYNEIAKLKKKVLKLEQEASCPIPVMQRVEPVGNYFANDRDRFWAGQQ